MKKRRYIKLLAVALLGSLFHFNANAESPSLSAEEITQIENKLVGKHHLSLQWVSWEKLGVVDILRDADGLRVEGSQKLNGNLVSLFGRIKVVDEKVLLFTGEIVTLVDHINNGKACTRHGTYEFRAKGERQYWRLQQMDNPCDSVTDYIDIHF